MEDLFQQGKKTTLVAGAGTLFFALSKGLIGFFSGSVVLMGDAIHSAADSVSTFLAWFGLKIAQKDPTEQFPYGFYKAENITSLLISFLIFFAGYDIAKESINNFTAEPQLNLPVLAISIAILDGIVMFLIGSYEMRSGQKINSQSLIADGKESRLHLLSSSVVVIGLVAALLNIPYLEGIAGIIIALFIFDAGWDALKDSVFALMDRSPSEEIEEEIKEVLNKVSGIQNFSNLKLRKSGPFVFGEVEAKVRKSVNIKRAHEISTSIEGKIKEKTSMVDSFSVKFTPFETEKKRICMPIEEDKGLRSKISNHFGRAKYFLFVDLDQGEIKNFHVKENPYREKEKRAGLSASKFVMEEKIEAIATREMGPISFHTLRDNVVDIYRADKDYVEEVLSEFSQNGLNFLKRPTREKK